MSLENQVKQKIDSVSSLCERIYEKVYTLASQGYECPDDDVTLDGPAFSKEKFGECAVAPSGFMVGSEEESTNDGIDIGMEGALKAKSFLDGETKNGTDVKKILLGIEAFYNRYPRIVAFKNVDVYFKGFFGKLEKYADENWSVILDG